MSTRGVVVAAVCGLIAVAAPAVARAAPAPPAPDDVPGEVRRALGDRAERVGRNHYRVTLADGKSLLTHGPDWAAANAVGDFAPGSPERPPVCAPDHRQHVLYARLPSQPDRYATVKPQIQSAIRRMNSVLNEQSIESGGPSADFRVRCDAAGQIDVGQFTTPGTDFYTVGSAASSAGYNQPGTNYTIFFDAGGGSACGVGSYWDDERLIADNSNNRGGGYAVAYAGCWNGRTPMHEASHNLGAVQYGSPYSTGTGAHCRDGSDVMCYSDGGDRDTGLFTRCSDKMHYDCGHDDYFDSAPEPGEYLAGHWNIGSPLNRFINFAGANTTTTSTSTTRPPTTTTSTSTTLPPASPPRLALRSARSAKVMSVPGNPPTPGGQIVLWGWTGSANQQWLLVPLGGDVYAIGSVGTGMALDVAGASTVNGGRVVQSPWNGAVTQWWRVVPIGPDASVLVSVHSGKVIDVAQASTADGAPLVQWTWHGGLNQIWVRIAL